MTKRRFIDPTQDIDRHVSESLGARSQRSITEDIENISRTPRTKRLQVLQNGTPIADVDAINLTGGVSTSVQGRIVTANFTGGGSSSGTGSLIVQNGDVDVDTAVTTLDFSANFVVTSSPSGEANISLAGSGATIIVQEGDSTVDAAVGTLDFDASDFNVTSSPAGEANIALAYGTSAGTPAEGNHTHTPDTLIVQNNDTTVAATASTVDFSNAFRVTETPANEANVFLDTRISAFTVAYPPKYSGSFTLTDADLTTTSRVMMWAAAGARDADEMEMDAITFMAAIPTAGSATIYWGANPGPIMGTNIGYRYIIADN